MARFNIGECTNCSATFVVLIGLMPSWEVYDKLELCCDSPNIISASVNDADDEIELRNDDEIIEEVHVDRFESIISGKDPKKPKNWNKDKPQDHYIW